MKTLNHTQSSASLIGDINANLQEMGSAVQLTSSVSASQMVSALNAEFYGIDGVTELSTSMSAQTFVAALNTNFGLAGEGGQYTAETADTVAKVNDLMSADALSFILCTDIHYNPTEAATAESGMVIGLEKVFDDSVVNMKAVADDTDIDALLCLGDMIDGNTDTSRSTSEASTVISDLQSVGLPLYIALGNHDNNRNGNSYTAFTRAQMKSMFMDNQSQDVTFANTDYKSDYYKDYASNGLRLIVIYGNSGSSGAYLFGSETRTFLQTSLANLPTGYKAIVITHVPPITKYNNGTNGQGTTRSGGENIPSGESVASVKDIILNAGDKVIAMLYGHCHQDNVWSYPFCSIGTCCNKGQVINGGTQYLSRYSEDSYMPMKALNSHTSDLWDVVLVKPTSKVIEMVRFGAGADRTIHYEPVECAAGSSVTLASKISGGTWGLRTSDQSKATVDNGVVTVGSGIASGTLLSVWCKSGDWAVNNNKQLTAGSAVEYWTIKVINT